MHFKNNVFLLRTESVAEKLLTNWLAYTLHPFLEVGVKNKHDTKDCSSPVYYLYLLSQDTCKYKTSMGKSHSYNDTSSSSHHRI